MIVDAARKAGKLDGICLSLHGAMVTETEDDAEGALLEALRGVVGPDVPIAATLDLHANATVAHGEERQRAGELSHLSAHRRLRARGAGRRAGAGGDGGQEEAALPAGAARHAGRRRARPHDPARPDARPAGQGRQLREGAGHRRRQHPGGLHLGRHSLHRPLDRGEPRARRRGARQGDRGRADRRDLAAARGGGEVLLSADRRRHRRGEGRRRQERPAGHRRRHRQSGRRRLQRHHAGAEGADRCRHRERGVRHDLRSGHGAAGDQGGRRRGDRGRASAATPIRRWARRSRPRRS